MDSVVDKAILPATEFYFQVFFYFRMSHQGMFLFSAEVSESLQMLRNPIHQSTSQKQLRNVMIKKQKRNIRGGGVV